MWIGKCHQRLSFIFEMDVILLPQMLDTAYPANQPSAIAIADLQVLGADPDRLRSLRKSDFGKKASGKKVDLGRA